MRARNIKPGFFKNDRLAELEPLVRLMFIGLWCLADREGRLEDRPKRIKAEVLPYDRIDCDKMLRKLHDAKFIVRYEVDGSRYIEIPNFVKHQSPHSRESKSEIPKHDLGSAEASPRQSCKTTKAMSSISSRARACVDSGISNQDSAISNQGVLQDRFEKFWEAYPRKVGKGAARKIWAKLKPPEELVEKMIAAVAEQRKTPQWQKDGGQYIPHPATWLSQDRWDDEPDKSLDQRRPEYQLMARPDRPERDERVNEAGLEKVYRELGKRMKSKAPPSKIGDVLERGK